MKILGNTEIGGRVTVNTETNLYRLPIDRGTEGQAIVMGAIDQAIWGDPSSSQAVYLASTEVFMNKQVLPNTEPLPPPITTYRLLGDPTNTGNTIFKMLLRQNKKYKIDIALKFPYIGTTSGFHEFQFKIMGGASWDSILWWENISPSVLYFYPNITLFSGVNGNQSMPLSFNTETAFIYENDSSVSYATLKINGIVATNSDNDIMKIYLRNIYRPGIDNSNPCLVNINSYMSAIECK